jgi:hypothetical protein
MIEDVCIAILRISATSIFASVAIGTAVFVAVGIKSVFED